MRVIDALNDRERDDIGKCVSCENLALEGDKFCSYCKDYWEDDPQWDDEFEDYWSRQQ